MTVMWHGASVNLYFTASHVWHWHAVRHIVLGPCQTMLAAVGSAANSTAASGAAVGRTAGRDAATPGEQAGDVGDDIVRELPPRGEYAHPLYAAFQRRYF
jgi:hypothetical protein